VRARLMGEPLRANRYDEGNRGRDKNCRNGEPPDRVKKRLLGSIPH